MSEAWAYRAMKKAPCHDACRMTDAAEVAECLHPAIPHPGCLGVSPGEWHRLRSRRDVAPRNGHLAACRLGAAVIACSWALLCATPAHADAFRWPQPDGWGTPIVLTYSFSNLLDGMFLNELSEAELRASTAEAFGLWSRYAPLHFVERSDSGPVPWDWQYAPEAHPDIRIGYHPVDNPLIDTSLILAHAFLPSDTAESGLAGDIHFNATTPLSWTIGGGYPTIDFLEVITHEIGHSLGVEHLLYADAIMQPYHGYRFHGLGTGYLLAPDVRAIQALYGVGVGSVQPMPEPATIILVATGLVAAVVRRRQRCSGTRFGGRRSIAEQLLPAFGDATFDCRPYAYIGARADSRIHPLITR